jgi:cell wall-associated NlpC family hydrolase
VAGNRKLFRLLCLGSLAVVLAIGSLAGCAKRVMRIEAPVEVAQVPPAESTPDKPAAQQPAAQQPAGSSLGHDAATLAKEQLGKPYQWGASGPNKFDCSGLVMYVYDNLGVKLPRVTGEQAYAGVHVEREDLQPGDLVFFRLSGSRIDHVGIYLGHAKFVHAPRKHEPVRTDSLNDSYWGGRFKGARRLS